MLKLLKNSETITRPYEACNQCTSITEMWKLDIENLESDDIIVKGEELQTREKRFEKRRLESESKKKKLSFE